VASQTVVISPHLDDAVLSCWHLLEGSTVVNVFTGLPEPGTVGWWDTLTGSSDSVERMHERRAEDAEALGLAGAEAVALGLLDEQYRANGRPPAVADALAGRLPAAAEIFVPLGIFLSADHALVRDAARELRGDVRLYADHPHAGIWGLPGWVTGRAEATALDVEGAWRSNMVAAGLDPDALRPHVHELDDDSFERKLAAVRTYRTQVAALECEAPFEQLRWEVTWTP
jgi:LmbE family N-acetylglucosaminyl deacetylase